MRPTWDSTFIAVAEIIAKRSTCKRANVGCVLVDRNNRIIATGYNGAIHGHKHCLDIGCLTNSEGRCIRCIHAEQNALLHAKQDLTGCTAYVTHEPCETCAKLLNQAGIDKVIFLKAYPNPYNKHFKTRVWLQHKGNMEG
jgi:dCMP deaminase